jgi:hypothetical protein
MARDIAQRDLDQAGHRISNLGDPQDPADATKVDTQTVPKPSAGSGSPGSSLLAAPADHVHPATAGGVAGSGVTLNDPTTQAADATLDVIWAQAVDLSDMPGDKVRCSLAAIVRVSQGVTGKVELRIGGDDDKPDGTPITSFTTTSTADEVKKASADIPNPAALTMLKLVANVVNGSGTVQVSGKEISVRSLA